jgi:hypothetical protein
MDISLFLKSVVLGLAIAAPLGPIGALCINRTLERGFWAGVAGGLGTAVADGVYATPPMATPNCPTYGRSRSTIALNTSRTRQCARRGLPPAGLLANGRRMLLALTF